VGLADRALMAARAVEEKLSVRELERLAGAGKKQGKTKAGKAPSVAPKSADTRALEKRLEEPLGLKANLKLRGIGEQTLLTLEIRNFDQLGPRLIRSTIR